MHSAPMLPILVDKKTKTGAQPGLFFAAGVAQRPEDLRGKGNQRERMLAEVFNAEGLESAPPEGYTAL